MHVLIPFAAAPAADAELATAGLRLPNLERLFKNMRMVHHDAGSADSYSLPHERVQARALGLPEPDGAMAWAAWHQMQSGQPVGNTPCAWLTPCHWHVHSAGFSLGDPAALGLDLAQAQALAQSLQPYLAADGLHLQVLSPERWLLSGAALAGLRCASPERVVGRQIEAWLPQGPGATRLMRLQGELQMLLYAHPVNDERASLGQTTVNALWFSGVGALEAPPNASAPGTALRLVDTLRDSALRTDWSAWRAAWSAIDGQVLPELVGRVRAGQDLTLTLCGERHARSYRPAASPWWQRWWRPGHLQPLSELKLL